MFSFYKHGPGVGGRTELFKKRRYIFKFSLSTNMDQGITGRTELFQEKNVHFDYVICML